LPSDPISITSFAEILSFIGVLFFEEAI